MTEVPIAYNYLKVRSVNRFPIGWVVIVLLLVSALVIVGYFYVSQRYHLIEPTRCPQVKGSFGLIPGTTGESIQQCGQNLNEPCVISDITLEGAVVQCNLRRDICSHFSYNQNLRTMRIINAALPFTQTSSENMYIRQT